MAKNAGGYRQGSVKNRSQTMTMSGNPVKRDTKTGRFIDQGTTISEFKGVRKEK